MAKIYSRRKFLENSMLAGIALSIPTAAMAVVKSLGTTTSIGLIADLHQDIMHDGAQRLYSFIHSMKKEKPDALFQLGDFAYPADKNKGVIEAFRNAHSKAYHVIGNHDTDNGHTIEECIKVWCMPHRYYAVTVNGILFLVLDGNDKGSPSYQGGYPSFINAEQTSWLQQQLKSANQPVIILSHQPLGGVMAIDNAIEVQGIINRHKEKVLLCINGHTHLDAVYLVDDIPYVHINSASYFWVGGNFKHESYDTDVHLQYPWIASTCPYESALFTTLTIHPDKGQIKIGGRKSRWKGPSPAMLGYTPSYSLETSSSIAPVISKRSLKKLKGIDRVHHG